MPIRYERDNARRRVSESPSKGRARRMTCSLSWRAGAAMVHGPTPHSAICAA
jgi:hypothetical protein